MIAFLGLRGTVVAAVLGAALIGVSIFATTQTLKLTAAEIERDRANVSRDQARSDLATCLRAADSAAAAEDARRAAFEANTKVYLAALDNARQAVEKARREKAAAEALVAQWREAWRGKSPTCAAALQSLDASCPELETY